MSKIFVVGKLHDKYTAEKVSSVSQTKIAGLYFFEKGNGRVPSGVLEGLRIFSHHLLEENSKKSICLVFTGLSHDSHRTNVNTQILKHDKQTQFGRLIFATGDIPRSPH